MWCFGQCRSRIAALLMIISMVSLASAVEISVSPTEIFFKGVVNEEICKNVDITSPDYSGNIAINDKWAAAGEIRNDLRVHNLNASNLGIEIEYTNMVYLDKKTSISICITPRDKGLYHGAVLYRSEKGYVGVGNWIVLEVAGAGEEISLNNEEKEVLEFSWGIMALISIVNIVVIVSVFLFLRSRKKANSGNNHKRRKTSYTDQESLG